MMCEMLWKVQNHGQIYQREIELWLSTFIEMPSKWYIHLYFDIYGQAISLPLLTTPFTSIYGQELDMNYLSYNNIWKK